MEWKRNLERKIPEEVGRGGIKGEEGEESKDMRGNESRGKGKNEGRGVWEKRKMGDGEEERGYMRGVIWNPTPHQNHYRQGITGRLAQ